MGEPSCRCLHLYVVIVDFIQSSDERQDVLFQETVLQVSFHVNEASVWCEQSGNLTRGISMETKEK